MIVLGIDPGGTTGTCIYDTESPLEPILEEVGGGVEGFVEWSDRQEKTYPLGALRHETVCESFRLDGRTEKPDLSPVEIIGFLKGTFEGVHFQTPTQAKSLITNDVLKRAGLYPKRGQVKGGHGLDALRHALYYLTVTVKHRETIELLFPKEEA